MARLGVLALGLLAVLSAACGFGPPSASQPRASAPTFAVTGPDPVRGTMEAGVQGGVVVHPKRGPFRVFENTFSARQRCRPTAPSTIGVSPSGCP